MPVAEVPPKDELDLSQYRTQWAPKCSTHGVIMRCRRTTATVRYYYCPVPGCTCSEKQVRQVCG